MWAFEAGWGAGGVVGSVGAVASAGGIVAWVSVSDAVAG